MNKAAQELGRLARGVPKTLTQEDRKRRAVQLSAVRYRGGRKKGAKNNRHA
jgi:hypothetical protein